MTVVRAVLSCLVLVIGGAAVALLAPGGLGESHGLSAAIYEGTVSTVDGLPDWVSDLGERAAVAGLLVLAGLLAWIAWRTPAFGGVLLVGAGAVLAYLASEAIKLVVDEDRPCRAFAGISTWVPCPPASDWSFPSNHATVAGALAAGVVLLAPRLALLAVPVAVGVAGMRVVAGVHYPHDVLAGLLLGAAFTTAVLVSLMPVTERLVGPRGRPSASAVSP
jgi:undecaprenyl-diphosphatase